MSCKPERHEWKLNDEELHPADGSTCLCGDVQFRADDHAYIEAERHCDGPNCPFGCGDADRNARFVEKVRDIAWEAGSCGCAGHTREKQLERIRDAHREIYNAPCKPVKDGS